MLPNGTLVKGRYRIRTKIAQGGMGAVYEATDEAFDSTVALKQTLVSGPEMLKAFHREARLLNVLRHPALPHVTDHFFEHGNQFLVMQYIEGRDLGQLLKDRQGAFTIDEVLEWADRLLDALEYLHGFDPPIIHRDIKPQNVKLTPRGELILLDFGLAKGTPTGGADSTAHKSVFGYTPHFAPIEQVRQTGTDPRSDLYSLAATLYTILTVELPPDANAREMFLRSGYPDPLKPAHELNARVPVELSRVLFEAMAFRQDERLQSATEFRRRIRAVQAARRPSQQTGEAEESGTRRLFQYVTVDACGDILTREASNVESVFLEIDRRAMIEFVPVPAGSFVMGSPADEASRFGDEGPQRTVIVAAFLMSKFQVTQSIWRVAAKLPRINRQLKEQPSYAVGDDLPVENVSWDDALEFCARISAKSGWRVRLPSEAEWEYACRAGSEAPFAFGPTLTPDIANFNGKIPYGQAVAGEYRGRSIAVGSLGKVNAFGLADMHGNIAEWCLDAWHDEYSSAPLDASAWLAGGNPDARVIRGGSWGSSAAGCRSATRDRCDAEMGTRHLGFRVVASFPDEHTTLPSPKTS